MGTRTKGSKPSARQLGELLQEQQEPFILEVYLAERGCVKNKITSSGDNFMGCRGNSGKFGSEKQSKKSSIPHLPKVLEVILCNKFCTVKGLRTKNRDDKGGRKLAVGVTEMDRNNTQEETAYQPDRFSSATNTTIYDSCSDNDIDEPSMFSDNFKPNSTLNDAGENKAAADAKFQWIFMEDSKQHSPQSVLEEISASAAGSTELDNITEDSILSAYLWNLLVQTTVPEKSSCAGSLTSVGGVPNSSAFLISKWVMQKTKQLLLDCVRVSMEKKHVDEITNIREMLLDLTKDKEYWGDYETEKREDIAIVIGNAIVEEITSEVVMDMMN